MQKTSICMLLTFCWHVFVGLKIMGCTLHQCPENRCTTRGEGSAPRASDPAGTRLYSCETPPAAIYLCERAAQQHSYFTDRVFKVTQTDTQQPDDLIGQTDELYEPMWKLFSAFNITSIKRDQTADTLLSTSGSYQYSSIITTINFQYFQKCLFSFMY